MKFDFVIGNPPYQEETENISESNGQRRRKSIFHHFQFEGDKLAAKSTVMIYPAIRWIQRSGRGMEEFGLNQINDPNLSTLYVYPDSSEIFTGVDIADGISIVVKKMTKKTHSFNYIYSKNSEEISAEIESPGENILPLDPRDTIIVKKIEDFVKKNKLQYLHERILPQKLFGIESDFVEKNKSAVRPLEVDSALDYEKEIKLYANNKAGKAGRTTWFISNRNIIKTNPEYIDKWKVVVSSANAGGQKRDNQIEILDNHSVFGRSRLALAVFDTQAEAKNFFKFATSYLIRFAFLMTDENLASLGKRVPDIGDYSKKNTLINFSDSIERQLYDKMKITAKEAKYIQEKIDNLRKGKTDA